MALTLLAANNAHTVLAAGISASATSLTVNSGTGSLFPAPSAGVSFFKLTLIDAATGQLTEIMHVTARTGDTMTIDRGQEGTTARAWSANDIAANMMTAGTLSYLLTNLQPLDPTLTAISALVGAANKLPYFNGPETAALTDLTDVGRNIIGKNAIADVLEYLGLGTAAKRNINAGIINGIPDMSSFRGNAASNGYLQIPIIGAGGGGQTLIVQWGNTLTAPNSIASYNVNIAFPNTIIFAVGNRWANGSNASMNVKPFNTQQIQIQNFAASGADEICAWLAIGY
ncbi:gp53-like domain-containing protein [Citrobacter braakii]|uniref:gp53-like domain-containing protein n=1 Tax=Citrobacter braakii TaxID=57706 RepID=UPI003789F9F1